MRATPIIAALAALAAGPAAAQDGFYVGLQAGLGIPASDQVDHPQLSGLDRKAGFAGAVTAGYELGLGWGALRGELELGWRRSPLDTARFRGVGGEFRVEDSALQGAYGMANLLVDYRVSELIAPYAGLGIGVAQVELNNPVQVEGLRLDLLRGDETKFAYQAIIGVSLSPLPEWTVALDYRYFATSDVKLDYASALSSADATVQTGVHQLSFLIRRRF